MALKKKFNEVEIPLLNEKTYILGDKEGLLSKTIKLDVSKKLKGKSTEIIFFIKDINGRLVGLPKRFKIFRSYVTKLIKNRTSYVEDSFEVRCKDVLARVKPFLVTRRKVSRSLRKALREKIKEIISEEIKEKTFYEVCESLIKEDIQKNIAKKIKKVYPPLAFEIRVFETKEKDKLFFEEKRKEDGKNTAMLNSN